MLKRGNFSVEFPDARACGSDIGMELLCGDERGLSVAGGDDGTPVATVLLDDFEGLPGIEWETDRGFERVEG